jgi:hypothetical protein
MNRTFLSECSIRRLLLFAAFAWLIWIAAKYAILIDELPQNLLDSTLTNLKSLFLGQFLIFLAILFSFTSTRLDRYRGKILFPFFAISALYVVLIPGRWDLAAGILAFTVITFSITISVRQLLRILSPRIATLGLGLAVFIAVLIPAWFFLGWSGLLNQWTVGTIFFLLAIAGLWLSKREVPRFCKALTRQATRLDPIGFASLEIVFVLFTIVFIWTHSPEAGSDSARSHLPLAQNIAATGDIQQYFVNWGRFMPKAAQTWSAAAILIGGVQLSKWLSWLYLLGSGLLIFEEAFRRTRNQNFSILAAAITMSCPYLTYLATTLYIDHLILLLNLASLILVFRSKGKHQSGILLLSALVMGSLVQIKYNTLLFALVWSITVCFYLFSSNKLGQALKRGVLAAFVFLVCASPWYLHTYANTGNPLYPYYDQFFNSPYWPDKLETTLGQDKYFLGEEKYSWLRFPWIVTFKTSQVSNRHNGIMGFWILALIPFGIFGLSRAWFHRAAGPILAGAAGILLICLFTLNSRYWLPAYPFLILGFLLSGYELSVRTKLSLPRDIKIAGSLIFLTLGFLTVPFWTAFNHLGFFTWEVYSGKKSYREWMEILYPGAPAIEQFNQFVQADDGVLCTNYEAVYAPNARTYEFPFWHTNILELKSGDDLTEFIRKNRLHYWAMNFRDTDDNHFMRERFDASNRFWTDRRLVAASHQLAVFDITETPGKRVLREIQRLNPEIDLCDEPGSKCSGWEFSSSREGPVKAVSVEGKILIPAEQNISQVFPIPPGSTMVEFLIYARAEDPTTLILRLEWLDAEGKELGAVQGGIGSRLKFDLFHGPIYGNIPPEAARARIRIRPWRTETLVFDPQIRFLGSSE